MRTNGHFAARTALAGILGVVLSAAEVTAADSTIEPYAETLKRVVTPAGRVHYAALKANPGGLEAYLASVAAGALVDIEKLPAADRLAFWINAYNAITLKTIINSYPIHASGPFAFRYPASSIRQLRGAWSNRDWTVLGKRMSLDDIEHGTLRKQFREPRVHMALVCAARGCPPLRNEPYQGARLSEQLDDQARRYLASPAGLLMQPDKGTIAVSSIFKWFAGDFDAVGGVKAFLARYAPEVARAALAKPNAKITYLDYDWALNDARGE